MRNSNRSGHPLLSQGHPGGSRHRPSCQPGSGKLRQASRSDRSSCVLTPRLPSDARWGRAPTAWLTARTPSPPRDGQPQPGGDGRWHIPAGTARLSGGRKKILKNLCFVCKLTTHRFYFLFEHSKGSRCLVRGFSMGQRVHQLCVCPIRPSQSRHVY